MKCIGSHHLSGRQQGVYSIRLIVFMADGVFIESGSGTGSDPYVLSKD